MVTLDGYQVTAISLGAVAVLILTAGIAHEAGAIAAENSAEPQLARHERCEGCGRDVCGCDDNMLTACPDTVILGCYHQRMLCTDCMAECEACRLDMAHEARYWGESR